MSAEAIDTAIADQLARIVGQSSVAVMNLRSGAPRNHYAPARDLPAGASS